MTTFAVAGATGHLGTLVIDALIARGIAPADIVALARDTAKAAPLAAKGVTVREADYDRPDTLASALAGVDRLLLISGLAANRVEQHGAVIDAAAAAGVSRIAYTSVLGADATSNPVAPDHVATEKLLAASGLEYAALRNGWYNENYLQTLATAQSGSFLTNAGEGRVASAARADYADAAAVVLTAASVSPVYELAGDVAWSQDELAAAISEVRGRPVAAVQVTAEDHRARLVEAGVPPFAIPFAVDVDSAIAAGELAVHTGTISVLTGRPTTPLVETLRAGA